jgi:2-hydroxy-4-carboxymuconate semialdehyde hemiacetal dehydrogenase
MTRNAYVVGVTSEEADRFADRWTFANSTTDLDKALADPTVDLVLITSPSQLHAGQARDALAAGKHVIVEIPAALAADEAEQLAALAQSARRRLLVCQTMRSFPAITALRERSRSGHQRIAQIHGMFAVPRRQNQNWTGGTRSWVDNLLWHHGCHVVDTSLWILNCTAVSEVTAHAGNRHPVFGMTMDLALTFSTPDRQLVTHALTYNTSCEVEEMQIVTDDQFLVLRDGTLRTTDGEEVIAAGRGWADLEPQDDEMIRAITTGRESQFDIGSVLPAMRVLGLAQAASASQ